MILWIKNAGTISSAKMEDIFDELFNAVVMAEIRPTSVFCWSTREAKITVMTSSPELQRFIRNVDRNGSDTFIINNVAYKVTKDTLLIVEENVINF
jgi:hypothetical protein